MPVPGKYFVVGLRQPPAFPILISFNFDTEENIINYSLQNISIPFDRIDLCFASRSLTDDNSFKNSYIAISPTGEYLFLMDTNYTGHLHFHSFDITQVRT